MKLKDRLSDLWYRLCRWVAGVDWRGMARGIINWIGRVLHTLLFEWLIPKRYRSLNKKEIFEIIFKSETPAG